MSHDCVKRINELLAPKNTQLAMVISLSETPRELIQLATTKVERKIRGNPVAMFASFCPFCGEELSK